jgi:hypothetical protein
MRLPDVEPFVAAAGSSSVASWESVDPAGDDAPRPLLQLALRRLAASRGPDVRASLVSTKVREAWRESQPPPGSGSSSSADRWLRWTADVCFYKVADPFGACETLDVRAQARWASGQPPTSWPYEVASSAKIGGPPPAVSTLLD